MNRCHSLLLSMLPLLTVSGLAQDPVLQVERRDAAEGAPWRAGSTLALHVALHHPSARTGGKDDDFVLDPDGGWAGAFRVSVTDAQGAAVTWTFASSATRGDEALTLHRLGVARVGFTFDPLAASTVVPPGRYLVHARLAATTGRWRGTVDAAPLAVEVVGPPAPEVAILGAAAGQLVRGWPCLVGVSITAAGEAADELQLANDAPGWAKAIGLLLRDDQGKPVALPCMLLPVPKRGDEPLHGGESCTVWFRIPTAATGTLTPGTYRWVARLVREPLGSGIDRTWSGTVETALPVTLVAAPAEPLPLALARQLAWAQVEDTLAEAALLRQAANDPKLYRNEQFAAARQVAVPLLRAERLARQWLDAHPDDAEAAMLVATVLRAEEDPERAVLFAQLATAAELRQRPAGADEAAAPSLGMMLRARSFQNGSDPNQPVLSPALLAELLDELQSAHAGQAPAAPDPATPTPAATAPAPPPVVAPPVVSTPPATAPPPLPPVPSPAPAPPAALKPTHTKAFPAGDPQQLDPQFAADGNGQWASTATASSQYDSAGYSAAQATGAPNVANHGDDAKAWTPGAPDRGKETLTLGFAQPVTAREIRVRQSFHPGAITQIELSGADGQQQIVFVGPDLATYPDFTVGWLVVAFAPTAFTVTAVTVTLDTTKVKGWNEIDAVQLVR